MKGRFDSMGGGYAVVAVVVMALAVETASSLQSDVVVGAPHPNYGSVVEYQTVSPEDVAKSLTSHLTMMNTNIALVFADSQLQSSDKDLGNLLELSFSASNFSMAFPYIADDGTAHTFSHSLLSAFSRIDGHGTRLSFSHSCSLASADSPKLSNFDSVDEYLASRVQKRAEGEADVVVFCHGDGSKAETFAKLVNSVGRSGETYAVVYLAEKSLRPIQYPSSRQVERFLAESTNVTGCGEVCKIKSSLLEGLLVGIVLLIILISGICCMMGIDTPTRFEVPQDS